MSDELAHLDIAEDEIASEEDFRVKRDDAGDTLPIKSKIPGRDKYIVHYPATNGHGNEYLPEDYNLAQMTPPQIAGFLNELLVRPDFGELTADDIESGDFYAFCDAETLVQIIADESGYDILKAQAMEMMSGKNSEMLTDLAEQNSTTR